MIEPKQLRLIRNASDMSAEAWCEKYGESLIEVYHEARRKYADLVEDNNE